MTEIENGKYLPVLYTIPEWNLVRGYRSSKYYYVPWLNRWISSRFISSYLFKIDKSVQDYYDRWFLNITVPSDRPKCPYCGRNLWFKELCSGYLKTCGSNECEKKRKKEKNSQSYREGRRKMPKKQYSISTNNGLVNTIDKINVRRDIIEEGNRRKKEDRKQEISRNRLLTNGHFARLVSKYVTLPENPLNKNNQRKRKGSPWRGINSSIYSDYEKKIIYFDSDWERIFYFYLINFERDNIEIIYRRSTIRIPYIIDDEDNTIHHYTPDFILKYKTGIEEIVEIKPEYRLNDKVTKIKINELSNVCYLTGTKFRLVTDKEIEYMRNKLLENNIDYL